MKRKTIAAGLIAIVIITSVAIFTFTGGVEKEIVKKPKLSRQPKPYLSFKGIGGSDTGSRISMVYTGWWTNGCPMKGYSPIIVKNRGDPGTIEVKLIKLKRKEGSGGSEEWEEDKVLNTTSVFLDKMEEKELRFEFHNPGYFGEEKYEIRALVNGQTAAKLTLYIPRCILRPLTPPPTIYNPPPPTPYNPTDPTIPTIYNPPPMPGYPYP
ncbi:MAG: hypothetical protein OCU22_09965 [Canidatus Methanoxibalbensis ujae]|nr:hypothetical protein [Candidatus Methanoxibalbensis ujae]